MVAADLIIPDLFASSKKQAFRVLADRVAQSLRIKPEELLEALLARERIGSTGIGEGVAIPHLKVDNLQKTFGVLVHLDSPVDYESEDGQPVDIIFLLLVPAGSRTTEHLKTLAHVARFLKDKQVCAELRTAKDQNRIAEIVGTWAKTAAA